MHPGPRQSAPAARRLLRHRHAGSRAGRSRAPAAAASPACLVAHLGRGVQAERAKGHDLGRAPAAGVAVLHDEHVVSERLAELQRLRRRRRRRRGALGSCGGPRRAGRAAARRRSGAAASPLAPAAAAGCRWCGSPGPSRGRSSRPARGEGQAASAGAGAAGQQPSSAAPASTRLTPRERESLTAGGGDVVSRRSAAEGASCRASPWRSASASRRLPSGRCMLARARAPPLPVPPRCGARSLPHESGRATSWGGVRRVANVCTRGRSEKVRERGEEG